MTDADILDRIDYYYDFRPTDWEIKFERELIQDAREEIVKLRGEIMKLREGRYNKALEDAARMAESMAENAKELSESDFGIAHDWQKAIVLRLFAKKIRALKR